MLGIVSSILIASGTLIGSGSLLQRSNMSIEIASSPARQRRAMFKN